MATIDDILRVTQVFDISGNSIGNMVWHYRVVIGTSVDYVAIATAIDTALATAWAAAEVFVSDTVSPISLDLAEWDGAALEWDGKATVTGTSPDGGSAGAPLPAPVAIVMRFPTLELRRQARKFLPGMLEANSNTDAADGTSVAAFIVSAANLNNDISADGLTLRPCTFNDTVGGPRFNTFSDFSTTSIVNLVYGFQRRRKVNVGI